MKLRRDQMLGSLAMLALVSACSSEQGAMTEAAGQQVQSIPVRTMPVTFQDQPNTIELPGRVRASAEAEIRPQVTGIIEARLFTEGDYVEAGQALYQIDDAEYVAAVQSARAALARAQATAENARETANRFERLSASVSAAPVRRQIGLRGQAVSSQGERLHRAARQQRSLRRTHLDSLSKLLATLSYQSVLRRGYALVRDDEGRAVRSAARPGPGDGLSVEFHDGRIGVHVDGDEPKKTDPRTPRRKPSGGDDRQSSLF